ncbi:hypothetical protein DOK76_03695 [Vagococcus sp. DIV0080]|uniref:Uncharacterized protein n=1 Tax=Candidatus Vagococcus giribetii TaxID=2230876 RepID=A0ABS3HQX5_9ENTE|nr:hypothetical protein [Vagococcus sp. DIV0080]MBO0476159.1 hypothetical protein [Vagococcus sp. DIV0080]
MVLKGAPIIDNKIFLKEKGYEDYSEISICIDIFLNMCSLKDNPDATIDNLKDFVNYFQNLNKDERNDLCEYIKKEENACIERNPDLLKERFCIYLSRYIGTLTYYERNQKQIVSEIMKKISSANL